MINLDNFRQNPGAMAGSQALNTPLGRGAWPASEPPPHPPQHTPDVGIVNPLNLG